MAIKKKLGTHKGLILFLVAAAQFMVVLDISIVNVALPSIFRDLSFSSTSNLQWVITAYTLVFGGFLLFGGRLADLYGRKKVFLGGVLAFTIASLLCGLAQDSGQLVIARILQGTSAAIMSPAALSIVVTTFKEGKERNRALGVWAAVAAGGAAVGVLMGGILTQYLDWRWNFFVNIPVGLLVLVLARTNVPESKADLGHKQLDLWGALLSTSGLMLLVYALAKAPELGWTDSTSLTYFSLSFLILYAFIKNEQNVKNPLMPLSIFKIRNVSAANLVQLPVAASLFSMFFFLTLYLQSTLGFSPVKTGFAFLPVTIVIGIASGVVSSLLTKIGFKIPLSVGPLFLAIGLLLFSQMGVGGHYLSDVLPGLIIMSMGLGIVFVSITIAATNGVPHDDSGLASGILNTSQQIGGALGLAVLSGVAASSTTSYLVSNPNDILGAQVAGSHDAFLVGMTFAITALVLALLFVKQQKGEKINPKSAMLGG